MKKIILLFIFIIIFTNNSEAIDIDANYAILMDYDTNDIIFAKNINEITAPSSTTKIMTSYIIFDLLENNKLSLDDKFRVSIKAWKQKGSRMFLEPDWKVSVDDLLQGLIIVSGNDAAVALAEGVAGSVENFVSLMNEKAKELGMKNTHFLNPNGLYEKNHFMSVYDLAVLSRALIKNHPEYYKKYFSQKKYSFNNISQTNRNLLLDEYSGVDGIKTGFTDYGKYSMVASVIKNNKRLIAVINGADSERSRSNQIKQLLDYGFSKYNYMTLYRANDLVDSVNVILGKRKKVEAYAKEDIIYTTRKENIEDIKVNFITKKHIQAPIKKGEKIAVLQIIDNERIVNHNLYATTDVDAVFGLRKIKDLFIYNCKKLIGNY